MPSSAFADEHRRRTVRRNDLPLMQMPNKEQVELAERQAFAEDQAWAEQEVSNADFLSAHPPARELDQMES